MDFHVFECSFDAGTKIVTTDPDPANIPAEAMYGMVILWGHGGCWIPVGRFAAGDGTCTADKEAEIRKEIREHGFYWGDPASEAERL